LPVQFGLQLFSHWPQALQNCPPEHVPQLPVQPSEPQFLPAQFGWQLLTQVPFWHVWSPPQLPQMPPQPSGPHCLPEQLGIQPEQEPQPKSSTSLTQMPSHWLSQQYESCAQTQF